jgi:hypothetical protein
MAPLEPVIHGKIDRSDYTVEKVYFESWPGHHVTGSLYRPARRPEGKGPAVLCPHGHWRNGRFYENGEAEARREVESGAEKTMEGARYPLQARCAMLARMGCTVFHYDMVGNADSKQIGHAAGFRDVDAVLRLQSAFGLQTWNSIRALDFLAGLDEVDPRRIAVTGASGGGTQTFFLCAVDDRPAVAFPAVMVSTAMQGGCVCENAVLLRVGTGNIELAALTAPRPLGMTGADDWTIDIEKKGLPELKKLYDLLGVPDLVDAKCYPQFSHNYNQVSRERMYAWVNRHLKLGLPEPVEEKPFVPIPPKDLSVFDAGHQLPPSATGVEGLRKSMAEVSDRQMAALVPTDGRGLGDLQRVVGRALRAILASDLPRPGEVAATAISTGKGKGYTLEKLTLARKGSGEEVPALLLVPDGWSGKVVVAVSDRGKDSILGAGPDGAPAALAEAAVAARAAVLAPDVFLTGELVPAGKEPRPPVDPKRHKDYAGYTFGYNRTVLANRAHDVLTAIGHARSLPGAHTVHLAGLGDAGLWAILARGLAGSAVGRTLATRPAFDFADVKDADDPRLLPGGVKYGGWGAFAALAAPGELWLLGDGEPPPVLAAAYRAGAVEGRLRTLPPETPREMGLAEWLGRLLE